MVPGALRAVVLVTAIDVLWTTFPFVIAVAKSFWDMSNRGLIVTGSKRMLAGVVRGVLEAEFRDGVGGFFVMGSPHGGGRAGQVFGPQPDLEVQHAPGESGLRAFIAKLFVIKSPTLSLLV
ncbi:unnamed protein product [Owenia fusiformis]|uniref:Uncharacterized protein n=1 Tax=Owenia fusiformis TaxID=6347 RepID=A0A8S4PE36_OWEFU|nr:unnamed protein product [Owenia fusiformis]